MTCKAANIIRIEEPDFGCEGRPEGQTILDRILLETVEDGQQVELEVEEDCLLRMGLDQGMQVNLLIHTDGTAMIQKQD